MPWDDNHPLKQIERAVRFKIHDMDKDNTPKYYGFVDKDGEWLIMQDNSGSFRYARGLDDYPGNWGNRDILDYKYYYEVL